MATMLNHTMATAKHMMGSAREGSEHAVDAAKSAVEAAKEGTGQAVSSARSTLMDGIHAVTGVAAMLRGLQADDALGWVGLSRRRNPVVSVAIFGAGFAAGAGAGLLFAPMSGADLRKNLIKGLQGLLGDAKDVAEAVESKVEKVEDQAEELAGKAKDAAKKVERKIENKVVEGAESLKDGMKTKAAAATSAVRETLQDAKSMMSSATDPAHETGNDVSKRTPPGAGHRPS
jgi:gas vesicle protein